MKDLQAFKSICSYKKSGYNFTETSYLLDISIDTVKKYWNLNENEIEKLFYKNNKLHKLSKHEALLCRLLSKNPMLSAKKLSNLMYSLFGEVYSARTVSRYTKELRGRYPLYK